MTEQLHFDFSLSCIGGGNGNPLQCSCLDNPRDGGAWWAADHGVARSWTRLSDFTFTFHFHASEKEMVVKGLNKNFQGTCLEVLVVKTFASQWREGNGTPLKYSCLENPMDRGAW